MVDLSHFTVKGKGHHLYCKKYDIDCNVKKDLGLDCGGTVTSNSLDNLDDRDMFYCYDWTRNERFCCDKVSELLAVTEGGILE